MSEDPCIPLKDYCPSDAVQERMAAIKAERKVKAAAEAEAFRLAIEKAKIEWEVEILMGLEDGKGIGDILAMPLETWPEHNIVENVRQNYDDSPVKTGKPPYRGVRIHSPWIPLGERGHKRYMDLCSKVGGKYREGDPHARYESSEWIDIHPRMYQQLVIKSTVLHDELNLAAALDAVQMGLESKVIDACYDGCLPLMKERAKFRLTLLRKIYPSLHEGALMKD